MLTEVRHFILKVTRAELARRSGTAALARAYPPGPEGVVYRPSRLEHRAHRLRFPGPVERRGIVQPGQEVRGRILGAFAPVGRQFLALAYVRDGDRLDASQPRPPDAGKPEVRQRHNEDTGGDESHFGSC